MSMVSKPATEWSDGWCFADIRDTSISCPTHLSISRLSFCPTRRRYGVPWIAFAILLLWLGNNSKKICASPKKAPANVRWKELLPYVESRVPATLYTYSTASDLMRYDTLMSLFYIRQNELPPRLMCGGGKGRSWMDANSSAVIRQILVLISSARFES